MQLTEHFFPYYLSLSSTTLPIDVYPPTVVRKNFVPKILADFQIKSPHYNGEGVQKPCTIKLISCLLRNNIETYYPCTWQSFVNQKNEKITKVYF